MTARETAMTLSGEVASDDDDIALVLLRDINTVLDIDAGASDDIASKQLHDGIVALEDRPWATWSQGRSITRHKVGRLLADFGIHSTDVRIDGKVVKAYRRAALRTAIGRYLTFETQQRNRPNNNGPKTPVLKAQQTNACSALETEISSTATEVSCTVALHSPESREREADADVYRY